MRRRIPSCLFCLAFALCLLWPAASPAAWSVANGNGTAWIVDPDGAPFYSRGVNIITSWPDGKLHGGNETSALAAPGFFWKKFYPDLDAWRADVREKLTGWGFNTRGGWSDPSPGFRLPRIVALDLGRMAELHWFDPFDPAMEAKTRRIAEELTAPHRDDPSVIGYFTDNEVGWWNSPIFRWYLKDPWAKHTKQVLWNFLHGTYGGDWNRLTRDFVPYYAWASSWEGLKQTGARLLLRPGGDGIKVINAFTGLVAGRYYQLAEQAIRAAHPGALIVGDRLPLYYNQYAVLAQAGHVDVLSTNYNVDAPDGWVAPYYFQGLDRLAPGTPVLISEYFFAARENRSGNRNNGHLMTVGTQAERAAGAGNATLAFARFPNVAGTHWFQLYDEPPGGRSDGEDYNFGLIDVDNRPYEGLVESLRAANTAAPEAHAAAKWDKAPAPAAPYPLRRLTHDPDLTDASITDWTDKAGTRLVGFAAPAPFVPFGDVHAGWTEKGLYFFMIAQDYLDVPLLSHTGDYPLAECFSLRVAATVRGTRREAAVVLMPRESTAFADHNQAIWEIEPQLYVYRNGRLARQQDAAGMLQAVPKPLPHITFELFLPASLWGRQAFAPGERIDLSLAANQYFRALGMTWPGPSAAPRDCILDDSGRLP